MRRSTASELRMLREIAWHFGTTTLCHFCNKPLLDPGAGGDLRYGERQFPPVKTRLAIHHWDEDHHNQSPENRKPCHSKCHKRHHIKKQHAASGGKRIGAKNG